MSLATAGESVKLISMTIVVRVDKGPMVELALDAIQCGNLVAGVLISLSLIRKSSRRPSTTATKEKIVEQF
jgi:hypothetical protein